MIWKKDEPEESTQEFYMEEAQDFELDSEWILEFQDQQREIIELWDACNVPLAHRSYFFILFKGDPSDAVYMEVELRRLFFIREAISRSTDASGRNAITQASRYVLIFFFIFAQFHPGQYNDEDKMLSSSSVIIEN